MTVLVCEICEEKGVGPCVCTNPFGGAFGVPPITRGRSEAFPKLRAAQREGGHQPSTTLSPPPRAEVGQPPAKDERVVHFDFGKRA